MKFLPILLAAATAVFTLSTAANVLAQTPGGANIQGTDSQELQDRLAEFQKMNPQQQQAALQEFMNASPQQQQAVVQQFRSLSPDQQQAAMQQFQKVDPDLITNLVQQRINHSLRDQMGVADDDEWSVIEAKIAAVTKARAALMAYGGGMMGLAGGGGRPGFPGMSRQRAPEAEALQQALKSDASAAQVQSCCDAYRTARQEKKAALVKAQTDLRAVLGLRQEALAVMANLLE
jgi:hypothetical protein